MIIVVYLCLCLVGFGLQFILGRYSFDLELWDGWILGGGDEVSCILHLKLAMKQ
jgi:hypothetical protein